MNVPRFPAPPSPLNPSSASSLKNDTNLDEESTNDDYRHSKNNRNSSNGNNLISKRRALHLARLPRLGNSVHPRRITARELSRANRPRVTQLTVKMTERQMEDEEDDADVICATARSVSPVSSESVEPRTISAKVKHVLDNKGQSNRVGNISSHPTVINKTIGVQTRQSERLYMLRVLPTLKDIADDDSSGNTKSTSRVCRHFRFIGRLCFCQLGLAWILTFWTVAGAAAFYATEGPRERGQVFELKKMQRDLAVGLATELRQIKSDEEEMEPLWSNKVKYYVTKHEKLLLAAVNAGYGEGGDTPGGQLWTFSGCVLFTISLITTLGFGAPVPRTTSGRTVAVIFASIGIPAHFILICNFGLLLAVHLQRFAIRKKYGPDYDFDSSHYYPMPRWVKIVPFVWIASYYLLGIIGFGVGRSRPLGASVLFPLDFTAAGGLATISSVVRVMYGLYLEGAVTIAAMTIAVLRVSATESLTNIGLKYGLLVEV